MDKQMKDFKDVVINVFNMASSQLYKLRSKAEKKRQKQHKKEIVSNQFTQNVHFI
jgi:hypothetical protein